METVNLFNDLIHGWADVIALVVAAFCVGVCVGVMALEQYNQVARKYKTR